MIIYDVSSKNDRYAIPQCLNNLFADNADGRQTSAKDKSSIR